MTSNCGCTYCTFNQLLKADIASKLRSSNDKLLASCDSPEITAGYWRKGTIAPERNKLVIGLWKNSGSVEKMYWTGHRWCTIEDDVANAPDLWIYIP